MIHLKDGEEALQYIFSEKGLENLPRLILLDLRLPKVDGLEVLQALREDKRTKEIPVVILTSSPSDEDRLSSDKLNVKSYIMKPVNSQQLLKVLKDVGYYWMVVNQTSAA